MEGYKFIFVGKENTELTCNKCEIYNTNKCGIEDCMLGYFVKLEATSELNSEQKANNALTKCVILQEVIQRILSTEIDNPFYRQALKAMFNTYLKHGERLNNEMRRYLNANTKRKQLDGVIVEDEENIFDDESDYFYDIIDLIYSFKTDEQYEKFIEYGKSLV